MAKKESTEHERIADDVVLSSKKKDVDTIEDKRHHSEAALNMDNPEDVHKKIVSILKEYNMIEADIPRVHEYWKLLNRYRGLTMKA